MPDTGRNDPCHCGSKKKYKKCHLDKDAKKDAQIRNKAALNAAKVAVAKAKDKNPSKTSGKGGWFHQMAKKMPFLKGRPPDPHA